VHVELKIIFYFFLNFILIISEQITKLQNIARYWYCYCCGFHNKVRSLLALILLCRVDEFGIYLLNFSFFIATPLLQT